MFQPNGNGLFLNPVKMLSLSSLFLVGKHRKPAKSVQSGCRKRTADATSSPMFAEKLVFGMLPSWSHSPKWCGRAFGHVSNKAWTASVFSARKRRENGKLKSDVTKAIMMHSKTFSVPRCLPDIKHSSLFTSKYKKLLTQLKQWAAYFAHTHNMAKGHKLEQSSNLAFIYDHLWYMCILHAFHV